MTKIHSDRLVFVSACLGMLLFGIALITLGSVAVHLREKFLLDDKGAGALFSFLPIGILVGSLLFGPFSDRHGYKIILVLSCVLMFLGFQGIAWADSLMVLKGSVILVGIGGGAINGATNAVVADISDTHKGGNLSLLGVFFAIGALGMPSVLGFLESAFAYATIVAIIGSLPVVVAALFLFTHFPAPKQAHGLPLRIAGSLLKNGTLLTIGFFLFCVSSFEAIANNWTTTYLGAKLDVPVNRALFALSLYVGGMAVMRLLLGSALRNIPTRVVLYASLLTLLAGCLLLHFSQSYWSATAALIVIGIGLASCFPLMLGLVGSLFPRVSGTAFSVVLSIALVGNMMVNLIMGLVGIAHLVSVALVLLTVMAVLSAVIFSSQSKS